MAEVPQSREIIMRGLAICEENPDHPQWLEFMTAALKYLRENSPEGYKRFEAEFSLKTGARRIKQ